MKIRTAIVVISLTLLAALSITALARQGAALQKPPRITSGALVKPTVTPGKFRAAVLPVTFKPSSPVEPFGAFFGQAQFDLTEGSFRVVGDERGNHVGVKVLLASANRPVTFDFEIYAKSQKKLGVEYKVGLAVAEMNGVKGSANLNVATQVLQDLKQTVSITATPTREGWLQASVSPGTLGSAFEVFSVTVRGS